MPPLSPIVFLLPGGFPCVRVSLLWSVPFMPGAPGLPSTLRMSV